MTRTKTLGHLVAVTAAALIAAIAAAPAQAATVCQLETVSRGVCLRPTSNPADLRAQSCANTPTNARDWQVIVIYDSYHGHPIWQVRNRHTGSCLGRSGLLAHGRDRS